MSLTFNIIYTPGTVRDLTFFVHSLLHWSDCSFRLVTNGCSTQEERYLQHFCQQDARLEFYRLPTDEMLIHGQALNHLQDLTQEDKFCFMDSDIYATGHFMPQVLPLCQQYAALSACMPIWCKPSEQVSSNLHSIMAGEFNRTDSGICLGGTYFAIYDNYRLVDFRKHSQIGFERCNWKEISRPYQQRLHSLKLRKEIYDTSKVINILWQEQGNSLTHIEVDALCHLGGVSDIDIPSLQQEATMQVPKKSKLRWQNLYLRVYFRGRQLWQPNYGRFSFLQRRKLYKFFWREYLNALLEQQRLPELPRTGEPEIEEQIEIAMTQVRELYQQFATSSRQPSAL